MLYWGHWYIGGKDTIVYPWSLIPLAVRVSVFTDATWNHINMSYTNCHQILYWEQWFIHLPPANMWGTRCVLLALTNLMSMIPCHKSRYFWNCVRANYTTWQKSPWYMQDADCHQRAGYKWFLLSLWTTLISWIPIANGNILMSIISAVRGNHVDILSQ